MLLQHIERIRPKKIENTTGVREKRVRLVRKTWNTNVFVKCIVYSNVGLCLENLLHPYQYTVILHGIQYGVGTGIHLKVAKQSAARSTLDILIPCARDRIKVDDKYELPERQGGRIQENTVSVCYFLNTSMAMQPRW